MIVVLVCYALSALSLVYPMYRYESSDTDGLLQDIAAGAIAVFLAALWPLWVFMLLRKSFLTELIGGTDE